ncbi:sensor histidine kinase [Mangrovicoccus ximenensis]|uniref:sensor histidine kinase n=1 Tax=Mangrovicoccus ximenensis TaxID=1911570 RepID=UPI000D3B583C|nr:HAMP domain-containing sensor histidine kinase [Mangrovicoccus ximenensis]
MLDLHTVLIVTMATSSLIALAWILVWRAWRDLFELTFLAAGFAAIALGILMMILRGAAPEPWVILVNNLLIRCGTVLIAEGLSRFLGQPSRIRIGLALLAAFGTGYAITLHVDPGNLSYRIHGATLFTLAVMSLMCLSLWRDRTQPLLLRGITIALLGIYMGSSVVQSLLELRLPAVPDPAPVLGDRNAWFLLQGSLFLIALFACLLVMVSFRLYEDLRRRNEVLSEEVSKRRRLEADLSRSLDAERGLREEQADFMRVLSHEFRTPLAIIRNGVDMLRLTGPGGARDGDDRIAGIGEALNRLSGLIDRFMTTDREAGFRPEPAEVDALLAGVALHFEMTGRGARLQIDAAQTAMPLFADPDMLETVMINLIDNALKYSPGGGAVQVRARREAGWAVIEVRDRGIGVPPGDLPKLGRRFFRGSNTPQGTGTGLGIYAAQRFLAYHRGALEIASRVGEGTVATVRLPLAGGKERVA